MSDRPAGVKATRSPWTDGAWIMEEVDAARLGWQVRYYLNDSKWWPGLASNRIVEARP
jgi:hypothetical protein